MQSVTDHILAVSAAWAFSCKGEGSTAHQLKSPTSMEEEGQECGSGWATAAELNSDTGFSVFCQAGTHSL